MCLRPLVDESEETSESELTVIHPGMAGNSEACRCEVHRLSWDGLVLERSNGARASHSFRSDGLCGAGLMLVWVRGEQGGLSGSSESITAFEF